MYHSAERRKEGAAINESLMALKECIRAKSQGAKATHHCRRSKLTMALKDSFFSPSAVTVVITTVSPASKDTEHSLNTLRHACIMTGNQDNYITKDKGSASSNNSHHGNQRTESSSSSIIEETRFITGGRVTTVQLGEINIQAIVNYNRQAKKSGQGASELKTSNGNQFGHLDAKSAARLKRQQLVSYDDSDIGMYNDSNTSSSAAAAAAAFGTHNNAELLAKAKAKQRRDAERSAWKYLSKEAKTRLQQARKELGRNEAQYIRMRRPQRIANDNDNDDTGTGTEHEEQVQEQVVVDNNTNTTNNYQPNNNVAVEDQYDYHSNIDTSRSSVHQDNNSNNNTNTNNNYTNNNAANQKEKKKLFKKLSESIYCNETIPDTLKRRQLTTLMKLKGFSVQEIKVLVPPSPTSNLLSSLSSLEIDNNTTNNSESRNHFNFPSSNTSVNTPTTANNNTGVIHGRSRNRVGNTNTNNQDDNNNNSLMINNSSKQKNMTPRSESTSTSTKTPTNNAKQKVSRRETTELTQQLSPEEEIARLELEIAQLDEEAAFLDSKTPNTNTSAGGQSLLTSASSSTLQEGNNNIKGVTNAQSVNNNNKKQIAAGKKLLAATRYGLMQRLAKQKAILVRSQRQAEQQQREQKKESERQLQIQMEAKKRIEEARLQQLAMEEQTRRDREQEAESLWNYDIMNTSSSSSSSNNNMNVSKSHHDRNGRNRYDINVNTGEKYHNTPGNTRNTTNAVKEDSHSTPCTFYLPTQNSPTGSASSPHHESRFSPRMKNDENYTTPYKTNQRNSFDSANDSDSTTQSRSQPKSKNTSKTTKSARKSAYRNNRPAFTVNGCTYDDDEDTI